MPDRLRIATAVSHDVRTDAASELVRGVRERLADDAADLCLLFASPDYQDKLDAIAPAIQEELRPRAFIGATGETVIADDTEYEEQASIVLWAARLPTAKVAGFHLSSEDIERLSEPEVFIDHLGVRPTDHPTFVLVGDPFSLGHRLLELTARIDEVYTGARAIGGMASAGREPGQNVIVFGGQALQHGISGAAIWGDVQIDTVVSQGCRPIGRHYVITKGERNIIYQLGGRPAMDVVSSMLEECSPQEVELARSRGLMIGRVINEYQPRFSRGDFLIRNPLGFDRETRALALNDFVRTGQTVQFHVHDAESATDDLQSLLDACPATRIAGALLFSCNGRGTRLFADASHDARALARRFSGPPVAGLFCAGEIGPVGQRNFLHGHTASIALFRDPSAS